nr:carboxypeptidase-like regulatory domain-containing protein [Mucilaginibacter sp. Bleaf8]
MLNDVVVVGYGTQQKVSLTGAISTVRADSVNLSTALAGRVAGVAIVPKKGRPGANPAIRIRGVSSVKGNEPLYIVDGILADKVPDLKSTEILSVNVLKDSATTSIYGSRASNGVVVVTTKKGEQSKSKRTSDNSEIMLTGQVVGRSDKQPLPGVQVIIDGTKTGVQTNADGRFVLKARKNDMLNFRFIGYEGQKVKVKNQDKLQVVLNESQQALSEVVVVGYGTRDGIIEEAHPAAGWSDFKKYLKDNARSPDGKTGVVKLRFIVNADNSLSNFEVKKSLSLAADQKAVELIRNGPAWRHNVSGESEKVTVRVRFTE